MYVMKEKQLEVVDHKFRSHRCLLLSVEYEDEVVEQQYLLPENKMPIISGVRALVESFG